jgi:EAL domain-containing protein (putative c-di-GMP-specific phosphodiesterase class I)
MTAKLDNCVALQAFQAASRWCTLGLSFGRVAINLSSESISDPKLVKRLTGHLAHARLASAYTTVEMVESVFFDHGAHDVAGQLAALRELGMTVDLDDFGTGFASLTHLRRFPVDRIKIDRSFVAGIGNSPGYDVIVSAIVKLGASLGLECVAEGVETPMQFKFLAELGCHCVQGYFFARPMSEHATTMWLTHYDDYRSEFQRALAVDSVSLTTPDNAQIDFVS